MRLKQSPQTEKTKTINPDTFTEYIFAPLTEVLGSPELNFAKAKQALKQADETLAAARKKADEIIKKAQQEGEKIKEKARIEGLEQGLKQGREEGQRIGEENFKSTLAETWKFLEAIGNLYQNLKEANEAVMVKLAITVAERVLLHEVSCSPEVIASAFKAAMDLLDNVHEVVLRAHPDDLAHLESAKPELTDQLDGPVRVTFHPDSSMKRGDLIAETEAGIIDATL
ncbi:MAG: hypothetical protein JRI34_06745, partial [Deltaproteobacteria bacterium]|nr:hypothetical protein [Deltaproteobacteria bacterium]